MGGFVVVMFNDGGWHALQVCATWRDAVNVHAGAINALRVVDHPHAEDVKIIPEGADYNFPPLDSDPKPVCMACGHSPCDCEMYRWQGA